MEEFMIGTAEDDNHLEDFFPKSLPEPLQPLIEYRIKLLMKTDALFLPGESQVVNTSCLINRKTHTKISMFLKRTNNDIFEKNVLQVLTRPTRMT